MKRDDDSAFAPQSPSADRPLWYDPAAPAYQVEGDARTNIVQMFMSRLYLLMGCREALFEGDLEKDRELVAALATSLQAAAAMVGARQIEDRCMQVLRYVGDDEAQHELHFALHGLIEDCEYNYDVLYALVGLI